MGVIVGRPPVEIKSTRVRNALLRTNAVSQVTVTPIDIRSFPPSRPPSSKNPNE